MNTKTEDIDRLIKDTLTAEEAKFYDSLDEQNLFQEIGGLFKGKNSWIIIIMNIMNIAAFGLVIYCLMQTFDEENTDNLMLWIAGFFFCYSVMSMIKIFSWMKMHRNAVMREMKRLELQISALSAKL